MMSILFFLLCSGCFHLTCAANRLRYFRDTKNESNWSDALSECNKTGESLVTLYDEHDAKFFANFPYNSKSSFWLGLHKSQRQFTTWSNSDKLTLNDSNVNLTKGEQKCEAIEGGAWRHFNCSEGKHFMCQNGNDSILIEINRNWCQALQYCRIHYTDLVSISDDEQNEQLKNESLKKPFWIGLLHDEWKWADKSCSTYRMWGENQPMGELASTIFGSINAVNSDESKQVLCSKGSVRITTINLPSTWEEALNYCKTHHTRLLWIENQDDQDAVNQWLNYTCVSNYTKTLWIGLRQSSVFGFWIWSDRIVNWHNWKNEAIPELSFKQCGVINATDYTWSEENCWNKNDFLCEEDIVYMDK